MTDDTPEPGHRHWESAFLLKNEDMDKIRVGQYLSSNTLSFKAINQKTGSLETVGIEIEEEAFNQLYATLQEESSSKDLPIARLFANGTRRELLQFALEEMNQTEYDTTIGEIIETLNRSSTSIRSNKDILSNFGIIEVEDPDVHIPHYRLTNNRPVKLLQSWDGPPLWDTFESRGINNLSWFFLFRADPTKWYSRNQIKKESPVAYEAINDYIDTLVSLELVQTQPGKRAEKVYKPNLCSSLRSRLLDLNEALRSELKP